MNNQILESFMSATGKIDYTMTNNYMFRYILQKHEKVLRGLICSLLHLSPEDFSVAPTINCTGDRNMKMPFPQSTSVFLTSPFIPHIRNFTPHTKC